MILITDLTRNESQAINWTVLAKLEIESELSSCCETLEPTWGLLWSMLEKINDYAEASIIAFITGSQASSEVIARTVVESSLNVMYILDKNATCRIEQYFISYIEKEKKELKNWFNLTKKMDDEGANLHISSINQKTDVLNQLQNVVNDLDICEKANGKDNTWPGSIFNKFKSLGFDFELDYRTIYAAMCSQTHNDAEDLLNLLIVKSSGNEELLEKL